MNGRHGSNHCLTDGRANMNWQISTIQMDSNLAVFASFHVTY